MKGNKNQRALWLTVLLSLLVMGFLLTGEAKGEPEGIARGIAASKDFIDTLSEQERSWLRDHPVISVVHDPDWPPVEFTDGHGELSGMSGDYLNLVEQRLGLKFKRIYNLSWQEAYVRQKRWEIDMGTCVARTPDRTEFWVFTKPYLSIPIVIATQSDVTYIAEMKELFGKKVALVKGYAIDDWITRDLPEIELTRVTTAQEGLKMLQRGEVFAYIDNLLIIGDYQAKMKITNIKIAGQTPYVNAQCMAVRKDWAPLAGILQKALESISETERNDIYRKWLPLHYEHGFNYTLLLQALAVFAAILLVLAYWNRKLAKEIKQRKRAEEALREKTEELDRFFTTALDLFCVADTDGCFRRLNPQWEVVLGYSLAELEGRAFLDLIHPEDLEGTVQAVSRLDAQQPVLNFVNRYRCKDGSYRWIEWRSSSRGKLIYAAARDITDRKLAEQAMQESESRFRQVVEASPIPIGISSLSGRIEYINPRFVEIFGYALEEVTEVDLWLQRAYPDPDYRETVATQWRHAIKKAASAQRPSEPVDVHITCRDGSERITQCVVSRMGDRLVTMFTDLTERIRSEEALRQANLVVENSPVVLFRWKAAPGWPVDMVSQNVINQFGYAQEELLSGAVPFASLVHPEDLDRIGREVREYSESDTERFQQEYRMITKSGEVRWVDDRTVVERNAEGQIDFYQGIVIDITERRRAEQAIQESESRFRQVVEASPIPIGISDLSGRIEYINPRFLETFGYALEEVSEVDIWLQRVYPDPDYRQTVTTQWRQAIEKAALAQRPSDPMDVHITCRDGSERIMQIFGSLMGDRLVVMFTDLTERIRSEEALRSLLAELEIHRATLEEQVRNRTAELSNANQYLEKAVEELKLAKQAAEIASVAKSDFMAHMSHELRTPLNHIIGFTELVVDKHFGDLNASQEEYLTDVLASSRHLLSLVNDVLDLSKVEAGKLELVLSPVDLRHLLQNSLFMVKEKAMKHGLTLSTDFNEIPESIEADERKLKQIVYNLLSNAVKFTPDGGHVELSAELTDVSVLPIVSESAGDGAWIKISIKDMGIGLKKEDLKRIFNPFEQVESTLNRKFQGTGLGLALVRNLVALHGGQVWAESEGENRGTVVSFAIPAMIKTICNNR